MNTSDPLKFTTPAIVLVFNALGAVCIGLAAVLLIIGLDSKDFGYVYGALYVAIGAAVYFAISSILNFTARSAFYAEQTARMMSEK